MKCYKILGKYWTTVVVRAESPTAALEIAGDVVSSDPRGTELDEMFVDGELKTERDIADEIRFSPWHQEERQKEPYEE